MVTGSPWQVARAESAGAAMAGAAAARATAAADRARGSRRQAHAVSLVPGAWHSATGRSYDLAVRACRPISVTRLLAMLGALLCLVGFAGPSTAVVGGGPADPAAWPYMAAIYQENGKSIWQSQFCGGTVVAPRLVVTAAHCLWKDDGTPAHDQAVLRVR
ncbi:MAG: trypsin-like serine protease, partial [Actinobacteria bacterium]|nr:trypsin-like serine protease [Actinomycetota bacterium]